MIFWEDYFFPNLLNPLRVEPWKLLVSPTGFQQAAGFLRIFGGTEPLDSLPIHPESSLAEGKPTSSLGGQGVSVCFFKMTVKVFSRQRLLGDVFKHEF